MKISTKGRYGVRILADIAAHQNGAPRLIREISESQKLSQKYVSRLVLALKQGGFIKSIRGARGGYILAKNPNDMNLLEVLEAMEGPISLAKCVLNPKKCKESAHCVTRNMWCALNARVRESFAAIKMAEVLSGSDNSAFGCAEKIVAPTTCE